MLFLLLFHYSRMPTTGPGKGRTEIMNGYRNVKDHKGEAHDGTGQSTQGTHAITNSFFP